MKNLHYCFLFFLFLSLISCNNSSGISSSKSLHLTKSWKFTDNEGYRPTALIPLNIGYQKDKLIVPITCDSVVRVFSKDGLVVKELNRGKISGGVCVDNKNNIYVVEPYNSKIIKYSATYEYVLEWGKEGKKNGELIFPSCITADEFGFIYVTDKAKNSILKFNEYGEFVNEFGNFNLHNPVFITYFSNNAAKGFYVIDGSRRVSVFDYEGTLIEYLNVTTNTLFFGITTDNKNNVTYIGEMPDQILVIDKNKNISKVKIADERSIKEKPRLTRLLMQPWGIGSSPNGELFIYDLANERILTYK